VRARSIVVVGSSNTDMIIRVPRIRVRRDPSRREFLTAAGGKGANQRWAPRAQAAK